MKRKTGQRTLLERTGFNCPVITFAAVCVTLLAVCSGCGEGIANSFECKKQMANIMIWKIYHNAYLGLPQGSALPEKTATEMETAFRCPDGGTISTGPVGVYPQCSKHGSVTDAEYLDFLQVWTSPSFKQSGPDDDQTFYIVATFAMAKYFGRPDSPMHDMHRGLHYAQECASLNFAPAQHLLGFSYLNGYGVQVDRIRALEYFEAAARQGYQPAADQLKTMRVSSSGGSSRSAETGRHHADPAGTGDAEDSPCPGSQESKGGQSSGSRLYRSPSDQSGKSGDKSSGGDVEQRLIKARNLFESGLLSKEEYEQARAKILNEL